MSTFPTDLVPQEITDTEERPALMARARSGQIQRTYRGGHFFGFELTWPPFDQIKHRRLMSFIAKHDGIVDPFELQIPRDAPLGTAAGVPVVRTAQVKGSRTLKTRGWYKRSRVLLEGDPIRLKQKVYRNLERATTDANGWVNLTIAPGLMQDVSDGEGIVVVGLTYRVHFLIDTVDTIRINAANGTLFRTSIRVREDPY